MSATGGDFERVAFVIILITIIIKVRGPKNSKKRGLPFLFSSKYANTENLRSKLLRQFQSAIILWNIMLAKRHMMHDINASHTSNLKWSRDTV